MGRGIFTQVLRTEYQVAAGKTFVVPWWGIGVFDLDLHDCLWAVATHHLLQLSIDFCRGMHGPAFLSAQALIIYLHHSSKVVQYNMRRLAKWYPRVGMFILLLVTLKLFFIMQIFTKYRFLTPFKLSRIFRVVTVMITNCVSLLYSVDPSLPDWRRHKWDIALSFLWDCWGPHR